MRYLAVGGLIMMTVACSNALDKLASAIPSGTASGLAYDSLIVNGEVAVYSFSGDTGRLLGEGVTDAAGYYTIALFNADQPVIIEVTGGQYLEEASGSTVPLQAGQKLRAVSNYIAGQTITVHATYWTTVAAGLAEYKLRTGAAPMQAVTAANAEISALLGLDITTTTPVNPTDILGRNFYLGPGLEYGFFAAGLSAWTAMASTINQSRIHEKFSSIAFAQLAYDDIRHDGMLDGQGESGALAFGSIALSPEIYRHALAVSVLQMAHSTRNVSGIIPERLLQTARRLNDSEAAVFGDAATTPIDETGPMLTVLRPEDAVTVFGKFPASADVTDIVGVASVEFLVDSVSLGMATDSGAPAMVIDSTKLTDGRHVLSFRATNFAGSSKVANRAILVANRSTVIADVRPGDRSLVRGTITAAATVTDAAGLTHVDFSVDGQHLGTADDVTAPQMSFDSNNYDDGDHTLRIAATNTVDYQLTTDIIMTVDNTPPIVGNLTPLADAFLAGTFSAAAVVTDAHLTAVEYFLDGVSLGFAADLSQANLDINSTLVTDGPYTLGIKGEDGAGNVTLATHPIHIDNTPPVISNVLPNPGTWTTYSLEVRAAVTDLSPVTLRFSAENGVTLYNVVTSSNPNVITGTAGLQNDGEHTISIVATDAPGNTSTHSVTVMLDATPPSTSATLVPNLDPPTCATCQSLVRSCTVNGISTDQGVGLAAVYIDGSLVASDPIVAWSFTSPRPTSTNNTPLPACDNPVISPSNTQAASDKLGNTAWRTLVWCTAPSIGVTCELRTH